MMDLAYVARTNVTAKIDEISAVIGKGDFTRLYFPEVKNISASGGYSELNRNIHNVLPSYIVPNKGLGWSTEAGRRIRIPNKNIHVDITDIDVEISSSGGLAEVNIQVYFEADFGLRSIIAAYYIRRMVRNKLKVLKRDIEAISGGLHDMQILAT